MLASALDGTGTSIRSTESAPEQLTFVVANRDESQLVVELRVAGGGCVLCVSGSVDRPYVEQVAGDIAGKLNPVFEPIDPAMAKFMSELNGGGVCGPWTEF